MMITKDATKDIFEDGTAIKLFVSAKKDIHCLAIVGYDDYRAAKGSQE